MLILKTLAQCREEIFAAQLMGKLRHTFSENSESIAKSSLRNGWYEQIINSVAWGFDLPVILCFAMIKSGDFPFISCEGVVENLKKYRRINSSVDHKTEAGKQIINDALDSMADVEVYALPDNEHIRDIFEHTMKSNGSFAVLDMHDCVGQLIEDFLPLLRDEEKPGFRFDNKLMTTESIVSDFDLAASEIYDPVAEPIRKFIYDSWDVHALCLKKAMICFDYDINCIRIGDYFGFEKVPRDVVAEYNRVSSSISHEALSISEAVGSVVERIVGLRRCDEKNVDASREIQSRILGFQAIHGMLVDFSVRIQDREVYERNGILLICDRSPFGFLNTPLPPI